MTIFAVTISGHSFIGGESVAGKGGTFNAINPANRENIAPPITMVDESQIAQACELAAAAFDEFRAVSNAARAQFLDTVAEEIIALGDQLIVRAMEESGLPRVRLEGERGRTVGQLALFAQLVREGSWSDLRIDSALPERQPPRTELRMRRIGLGPVAVFAASNFPLAFSVGGGDTAAAFAAGCPVVVKAHSAHPGTSELVAGAIVNAVQRCGLPVGVFALITGTGNGIGQALVRHPAIKAVGFTGSRSGGVALMQVAAARLQPIPVYAEMSSINPLILLPHALADRTASIAQGFAASLTMGVGQFCTNPGLVLGIKSAELTEFAHAAAAALKLVTPATMLSAAIAGNYAQGVTHMQNQPQVTTLVQSGQQPDDGKGAAALFLTSGSHFLNSQALKDEIFGPAAIVVACDDYYQLLAIIESLEGQLTATLQIAQADYSQARLLLPALERKVGRILINGFPTGVEVSTAMVHGGPYPATSDGRSSSVGTAAIERFLRPVCYQNFPADLLPEAMRDDNDSTSWLRRDGNLMAARTDRHPS